MTNSQKVYCTTFYILF